jgi:hypothetical protein
MADQQEHFSKVQALAYQYFLERRGQGPQDAQGDWFRAENDLRNRETPSHTGPAQAPRHRALGIVDENGKDIENPT